MIVRDKLAVLRFPCVWFKEAYIIKEYPVVAKMYKIRINNNPWNWFTRFTILKSSTNKLKEGGAAIFNINIRKVNNLSVGAIPKIFLFSNKARLWVRS